MHDNIRQLTLQAEITSLPARSAKRLTFYNHVGSAAAGLRHPGVARISPPTVMYEGVLHDDMTYCRAAFCETDASSATVPVTCRQRRTADVNTDDMPGERHCDVCPWYGTDFYVIHLQ